MTIGVRLKELRELNNFTQELVAEYINYTTEGYIKLEQLYMNPCTSYAPTLS
ncbi:hypothetical protein [Methanosphaera sp.]|jgi:transcriptional regulator with XRE-family HTH domain|uniref:hypothetical protein n=1 Tax=Methanosphaera sp. TaxID=2666342 RepID=UPI003D8E8F42